MSILKLINAFRRSTVQSATALELKTQKRYPYCH